MHEATLESGPDRNPAGGDWLGTAYLPPAGSVKKWLVVVAVVIVALGCVREWLRLSYGLEGTSFFNLNREQNLGAWFSATLLANCALLLLAAGRRATALQQPHRLFWFILCATFLALSIDEASSIHESLMGPIQSALQTEGLFRYAWVVPALVLVPLFALTSVPFLLNLPRHTALEFVGAGAVYVTGALGFEMLEGLTDGSGVVFVLFYLVEEALEITGILLFLFSLMDHLAGLSQADARRHVRGLASGAAACTGISSA
jgi:hypothetical protein